MRGHDKRKRVKDDIELALRKVKKIKIGPGQAQIF